MKNKLKTFSLVIAAFLLTPITIAEENKSDLFNVVYTRINSEAGQTYLVTDLGTYRVDEKYYEKVDVLPTERFLRESYPHIIHEELKGQPPARTNIGLLLGINLFIVIMLIFYFQHIVRRHNTRDDEKRELYKQQLELMTWANTDTILDCDLVNNMCRKLNQHSSLELPSDQPHLLSEAYLQKIYPKDRERLREVYENLINSKTRRYEVSYRIEVSLGKYIWLVEQGIVMDRNEDGSLKRLICSIKDVSDTRQELNELTLLVNELRRRLKLAEAVQSPE